MKRVVHFEINADEPERAVKFYKDAFGWKISKWKGGNMEYWVVDTGKDKNGINGGIMKRMNPATSTVNTIDVESLEIAIKQIEKAGGKMVSEKMTVPR